MAEKYPKLRSDLIVHAESEGEQTIYVIKDPVNDRYFRLRAPEYYLLSRADGATTSAEAALRTQERFGIRIPEEAARSFFEKMERMLFFEGTASERYREVNAQLRTRSMWIIPLKAFDPDALLSRWIGRLRFLFMPVAVATGLALIVAALVIAASQQHLWQANLAGIWQLTSLPLLLGAVFVLALVHEFGHALTLKYYGGSVHEMGFLLLYFQPCFYSNISDTYLLPGRRPRLLVGLAGLFFQGVLTALVIFLWRVIEPGNLLSEFLWVTAAVSLILILFNFNPLIKLDGYYLLVDALRIPNLRAKAFAYWRTLTNEWLWGTTRPTTQPPRQHRRIFLWYGLTAAIYTGLLVGWILFWSARYLYVHWGWAGDAALLGVLIAFAMNSKSRQSSADSGASETDSSESIHQPARKTWRKPIIVWGGLSLLIMLSFVIRLERRVDSPCEVEAGSRFTVIHTAGGTFETELYVGGTNERRARSVVQANAADFSVIEYTLHVREGDSVHVGDSLLVLVSNRYHAQRLQKTAERDRVIAERRLLVSGPKKDEILQRRAELSELEAQVDNKHVVMERARSMSDRELIAKEEFDSRRTEWEMAKSQRDAKKSELDLLISGPKSEELAIKEAQIAGLDAAIEFLDSQIAASTITAPIDGIVTRVERGGILVEVAALDFVRLRLTVDQDDFTDVRLSAPVTLKVRSLPFETFHGRVVHVAADAETVGDNRQFMVLTDIDNPGLRLRPGMTGFAKISCGKRPLVSLVLRRLIHFIRVEFWSWW